MAIALVIALDLCFIFARRHRNLLDWKGSYPEPPSTGRQPDVASYPPKQESIKTNGHIRDLLEVIRKMNNLRPDIEPLKTYKRSLLDDNPKLESGEIPATSKQLGEYLQITDRDLAEISLAHTSVLEAIPKKLPPGIFSGRGLVLTGGGTYFPMLLVAVKWIRDIDPTTPIEVFMGDASEYEPTYCDELFPTLNTKCVVLENVMGKNLYKEVLSKYAFKPLAILMSSFDEVYFMDADSYPLHNLTEVFESKPYKTTGMVLNGDYWDRYISPKFFDIAGVELGGSPSDIQSERPGAVPGKSTESGQLAVSKSLHFRSLLLTCYYNVLGPEIFFPLIMQGGPGEGDKDTYAVAATIMGEKFYQTQRRPVTLGYRDEHDDFKGKAMVQPHPVNDYAIYVEKKPKQTNERFLNLHANYLKMNPKYLIQPSESQRGIPTLGKTRYFGDRANIIKETLVDEDIELRLFRATMGVTCDWALRQHRIPKDWNDQDVNHLCEVISAHVTWLENNWM